MSRKWADAVLPSVAGGPGWDFICAFDTQLDEDLQRHPPVGQRTALRAERDQPAADAAGIVDHAGQSESPR
jgi:hypothetical protein